MGIERDESLCKYNSGSCPNKRAIRSLKQGLLRLCEYHRRRANTYQKKYLQRHKKERRPPPTIESELAASSVPPEVAAAPFVVFVIARETNIATSLMRLTSAGECAATGQPLPAVACESRDQLVDLLRRIGDGEPMGAVVGPQSSLAMATTTAPAPEQPMMIHTDELNPLHVLSSTDTESSLSQDDADWLSGLLNE